MKASCQIFAEAVLDEAVPRPEGLQAHLGGCEECAALAQGHLTSQRLEGAALHRTERTPVRAVVRRAAAVGVAMLALVWAGLSLTRQPDPIEARPSKPEELRAVQGAPVEVEQAPMLAVPSAAPEPGEGLALLELSQTVHHYARVNPVAHGYGPRWKSLPALLAPPRSQPLASLEKSFHPLVFTSEE